MSLAQVILSQNCPLDAIEKLVEDFNAKRQILTVVQVGACNGRVANDPLHEVIKNHRYIDAHLIEAVKPLFESLVEVMTPYRDHVQCYNLAISKVDEVRNFYSVSETFSHDHPAAPAWKKVEIGSLTDVNLKQQVLEKYIQVDEMQCVSPATFLGSNGIDPKNLNLLITDTEGFDGEIVSAFLDVAHPDMVVYEHHIMPATENESLLSRLERLRYSCKKIGDDIIAFRSASSPE